MERVNQRPTRFLVAMLFVATWNVNGLPATEPNQLLTHDGKQKFAPVFVNGGQAIVYSVLERAQRVVLKRLDLTDGSQHLVLPEGNASQFDVDFSSDGRLLCYAKSDFDRQLKLVILDIQSQREFIFSPAGTSRSTVRTPRFLPGTAGVIFTVNGSGGQQIVAVDLEAKNPKELTTSNGANGWPAVSPNGQKIVFSSSRKGVFNLYIMDRDGSNLRRLTEGMASDLHASWSPDGNRIAFTSTRAGNYEVYLINADGTNLRRFTNHPERDDFAIWHPDGRRMLTIAERGGRFDLHLTEIGEPRSANENR